MTAATEVSRYLGYEPHQWTDTWHNFLLDLATKDGPLPASSALTAVLELHTPTNPYPEREHWAGRDCPGDEFAGYDAEAPEWPCKTILDLAAALGHPTNRLCPHCPTDYEHFQPVWPDGTLLAHITYPPGPLSGPATAEGRPPRPAPYECPGSGTIVEPSPADHQTNPEEPMSTDTTDVATTRQFPPPAWDDYATEQTTGRDMWWEVGKALIHPDRPDDPATYRSRAALAQLFLNAGGDEARGQLTPRLRGFINDLAVAFALEHASPQALQHLPLLRLTRNEENTRLVIDINYQLMFRAGRHDLYKLICEWLTSLGLRPNWIGNGQDITVDTTTQTITTRYYTPMPGTDPNAEYIGLNYLQGPETGEHLTTETTITHTGPLPTPPAALADFTHTT